MPSRIILPAVIIMIIGGLLLASCGGEATSPPAPASTPTPAAIDAGALYETNCVPCHGADRQGVSGVGLPLTPESLAPLSDAEVRDTIQNGRLNTAMAPFKSALSQEEIEALVQFIKDTPQ